MGGSESSASATGGAGSRGGAWKHVSQKGDRSHGILLVLRDDGTDKNFEMFESSSWNGNTYLCALARGTWKLSGEEIVCNGSCLMRFSALVPGDPEKKTEQVFKDFNAFFHAGVLGMGTGHKLPKRCCHTELAQPCRTAEGIANTLFRQEFKFVECEMTRLSDSEFKTIVASPHLEDRIWLKKASKLCAATHACEYPCSVSWDNLNAAVSADTSNPF
ncbi:hypothetical protein Pelo_10933 [Pelomyxa schiedti]|nr:hypothetical protein Pelo_10933 [Pelomyxa schiedti]